MAKNPARRAAQLRVMLRRWQQRACIGAALAVLSIFAIGACWVLNAHPFLWLVSALAFISSAIEILADINAFQDTRKKIQQLEGHQPPSVDE